MFDLSPAGGQVSRWAPNGVMVWAAGGGGGGLASGRVASACARQSGPGITMTTITISTTRIVQNTYLDYICRQNWPARQLSKLAAHQKLS